MGYYYEVEYHGKERATEKICLHKIQVSSDKIEKKFQYTTTTTAGQRVDELESVRNYLMGNLPPEIEYVVDYQITRKDEFSEPLGVTRTQSRLVCKWSSCQTFVLTKEQSESFIFIENQVQSITLKWQEWKALFGLASKDFELLQKTAPTFFSIVRESMILDIMLSIRRLFDPPKQFVKGGYQQNCTFPWLARNLAEGNKRAEFATALSKLETSIAFLTPWRHKVIAHNDHEHALRTRALPDIEQCEIDDVIKKMSMLLNIIQLNLSTNTECSYMQYDSIVVSGGSRELTSFLKRGVQHRDDAIRKAGQETDKNHL